MSAKCCVSSKSCRNGRSRRRCNRSRNLRCRPRTLKCAYDGKKEHQKAHLEHPRSPEVAGLEAGSSDAKSSPNGLNHATSRELPKRNGKTAPWEESAATPSYASIAAL